MSDTGHLDRRQFTRWLATAAGSSVALAAGREIKADDQPAAKPAVPAAAPADPAAVEPPPEEVLLLSLLVRRYTSEHYDDAALRGIYQDIRNDRARGRVLSEFPLVNSDEPAFLFRALRRQE